MRHAFTLVEMLVVIAVIAVLSVVVILILNPAETLKQSRDSNRVSDLSTLKTALAFYETQGGSGLGNTSTSYVSMFDLTATSSAGDQCQGLGLPSLPAGWSYHCAASSSYKNIDGTGWVPVNFSASQLKPPIAQLPVDPINTASTGYYFTYTTNGTTYEMTASLESQKFASTTAVDGGQYSDLYETGSNLALAPTDYGGGGGGGGGFHNGYTYARSITMSNSNVSGTLSNFPMLFSGTYSYLAASSSAGNVQNPNGYDIVFTSDSGCSSKLNFEQDSYTSSTGNIIDWVKVPSITGGTVIYLCYGNGSTTTSQTNASATWDGHYLGVYHLPNGTTLTANDSTSNGNIGTVSGPTATAGEIDGGGNFVAGSSQNIDMGNVMDFTTGDMTMSAWINAANANQTEAMIMSKRNNSSPFQQYDFGIGSVTSGGSFVAGKTIFCGFYAGGGGGFADPSVTEFYHTTSNVLDGSWHYVSCVRGGAAPIIYVDGVSVPLTADVAGTTNVNVSNPGDFNISWDNHPSNGFFNGKIDEARVSNLVRSSQWILTEYNNQSSPSTFYTVGSAM